MNEEELRDLALEYHLKPQPGKISVTVTKPTETQYDLSLAYTPGVAEPVKAIAAAPEDAYKYTSKSNLVGVISNGTAVLGLGNVGALASKPVMEGKAVLFKRFANVDVFDIEVNADDPDVFIETVTNIAPTFGGINLEDIKGPECFKIESELQQRLDIPVFHDDQHGTAITIAAALLNALELQQKSLETATVVCLGAGAAGIATMRLLKAMGAAAENLLMVDRTGVIHSGREGLSSYKQEFAVNTTKRTLTDALTDADVFIGVSGPNLVSADMLKQMAPKPVVFALSNPVPEIKPEVAKSVRQDLIMATGRSDYPNQVNNVLCFPYIFRGALDVKATCINQPMLIAAVEAIRAVARLEVPEQILQAYPGIDKLEFGPEYILPKPMDSRLLAQVPAAVAKAAIASGVARAPYPSHYQKFHT